MYDDLISIIVPIYNKENTLKKCVDSLVAQTYKNLEIILVDDGSVDNSLAIATKYTNIDERIKVLKKNNGGVCSARNLALEIVAGRYITFVDSDDWIGDNFLESMYSVAQKSNADIVFSKFIYDKVSTNEQVIKQSAESIDSIVFSKTEICYEISKIYNRKIGWENCSKLFKREIVKGIKYDEDIAIGEDWLFFCKVLERAELMVSTSIEGYHYVFYENSAVHKINESYISACLATERVLKLNLPFRKNDINRLKESISQSAMAYVYQCKKDGKKTKDLSDGIQYINKYKKYVYLAKESSLKRKMKFLLKYIYINIS